MTACKDEYEGGWIGIDFDGCLAAYEGGEGPNNLGKPLKPMVDRVKKWIKEGKNVRIMTARVAPGHPEGGDVQQYRNALEEWCVKHLGKRLPVTHEKDYYMQELWDDRVVQVEFNTGKRKFKPGAK